MQENSLGDIIRSLRKQAKMTQEDLADGICSPVSISRIESGKQMPSSRVLSELLGKLGTSTYQICNVYYKNEKQMMFEQRAKEITKFIGEGNLTEAQSLLKNLEGSLGEHPHNTQQYLLLEASIMLYEQNDPFLILDKLQAAIVTTKPSFDYNDFRSALLSVQEANILGITVVALYHSDRVLEAIRLGEELMFSLRKQKSGLAEYQVIRINLAFNLAQCMERECRYKEALDYSLEAESLSLNSTEQILLPEIEFIKAKAFHLSGNDAECERILKAVVPYMELIQKNSFASLVRNYAERELNLQL